LQNYQCDERSARRGSITGTPAASAMFCLAPFGWADKPSCTLTLAVSVFFWAKCPRGPTTPSAARWRQVRSQCAAPRLAVTALVVCERPGWGTSRSRQSSLWR